jgi:hypothetical protein
MKSGHELNQRQNAWEIMMMTMMMMMAGGEMV